MYPHLRRLASYFPCSPRESESRSSSLVPELEDFCWGCTEHSENAAQGSVRVQVSTVTITMTYPPGFSVSLIDELLLSSRSRSSSSGCCNGLAQEHLLLLVHFLSED
jgi:hypothetical protein